MDFTKASSSAFKLWKVDPDKRQYRGSGKVKEYTLPQEELEKYKDIKPYSKPNLFIQGNRRR